jgi:hypothetical protein
MKDERAHDERSKKLAVFDADCFDGISQDGEGAIVV